MPGKKHEDTSVSLHGMTIEEALKKALEAGPYPKTKKPKPSPSTNRRALRRSSRAK